MTLRGRVLHGHANKKVDTMLNIARVDDYFYITLDDTPGDNVHAVNAVLSRAAEMYAWNCPVCVAAKNENRYYLQWGEEGEIKIPLLSCCQYNILADCGKFMSRSARGRIMTEVFDHTSHKRLWKWLSKHPDKTKYDALHALGMRIPQGYNKCYACLYAVKHGKRAAPDAEDYCGYCPLVVTESDMAQIPASVSVWCTDSHTDCLGGLYVAWEASKGHDPRDARKVAQIIANLSVRAGVPTK